MPLRNSLTQQVAMGAQRLEQLQAQLQQLQVENKRQRFDSELLAACCECLRWLHKQHLAENGSQRSLCVAVEAIEELSPCATCKRGLLLRVTAWLLTTHNKHLQCV